MNIKNKNTIVIKIGTTSLIHEGKLNQTLLHSLAEKIKQHQNTHNFVIVTSGAVSLGGMELNYKTRPKSMKKLQVASAVGQIQLINEYKKVFNENDLQIAQVLITKNLIDDREQFVNTTQALNELLAQNIIPVINENDVVAIEELKYGDNDRLAAIVAIILKASKLILITNKDGLFKANPDKVSNAKKIDFIQFDSEELNSLIPASKSGSGSGGFSTKIIAAQMAGFSGISTQIISWKKENFINAIENNNVGTFIKPSNHKLKLKKLWIAFALEVKSTIYIDKGAFLAISKDASLLTKGVINISKNFLRYEGLEVIYNGKIVAKGISNISSEDLNTESLLIHKDSLIIL